MALVAQANHGRRLGLINLMLYRFKRQVMGAARRWSISPPATTGSTPASPAEGPGRRARRACVANFSAAAGASLRRSPTPWIARRAPPIRRDRQLILPHDRTPARTTVCHCRPLPPDATLTERSESSIVRSPWSATSSRMIFVVEDRPRAPPARRPRPRFNVGLSSPRSPSAPGTRLRLPQAAVPCPLLRPRSRSARPRWCRRCSRRSSFTATGYVALVYAVAQGAGPDRRRSGRGGPCDDR
jgi:hypothetical protein